MTEAEFRFDYCKLLEFYQYIEERIKYICAFLLSDEEKGWIDHFLDMEIDRFGSLIKRIRDLQNKSGIFILTEEEIETLDEIRKARNYWVHGCFEGKYPVIFKKGELKNPKHGQRLRADLNETIEWDKKLTEALAKKEKEIGRNKEKLNKK